MILRASRRVASPARQPDPVPCDKHAGGFNFFFLIFSLSYPLLYLENIVIGELADSLCRGGGVPLRDRQGERESLILMVGNRSANTRSKGFVVVVFFGKRNP